ncbi:MAG: helix-turn-helix domain-containing protein [Oscillospiraceae bacterium]|nr:helix-turn-helix domain-containing protein [Oscillospiraceae bacterium]
MSINQVESKKLVYTVKEVSEMLGLSLRSTYNLCNDQKDFKVLRLGEKSIRVNKESFDNWFLGL